MANPPQAAEFNLGSKLIDTAFFAFSSGTTTWAFTSIPFWGGALFGTVCIITAGLVNLALRQCGNLQDEAEKTRRAVLSLFAGIAIACAVLSLVGFTITIFDGICLLIGAALTELFLETICSCNRAEQEGVPARAARPPLQPHPDIPGLRFHIERIDLEGQPAPDRPEGQPAAVDEQQPGAVAEA